MLDYKSMRLLSFVKALSFFGILFFKFLGQATAGELENEISAAFDLLNEANTLQSAENPLVKDGFHLPSEIIPSKPSEQIDPFAGHQINPVDVSAQRDFTEAETKVIEQLIPLLTSGEADSIPQLFVPFANNLPPTETDVKLHKIGVFMIEMMSDVPAPEVFFGTTECAWKPLVDAKNPAYRHLALQGIHHSEPEEYQKYSMPYPNRDERLIYLSALDKFEFYQEYFDEVDHNMLLRLYRVLATVPLEANLEYLRSQLSVHEVSNNHDLVQVLRESIGNVETLISSPPENLPESWNKKNTTTETLVGSIASRSNEVVEGVTEISVVPKVEEPIKVVTAQPVKESIEQSSNWWLWLIGAVVVFGGIGLIIRKKS